MTGDEKTFDVPDTNHTSLSLRSTYLDVHTVVYFEGYYRYFDHFAAAAAVAGGGGTV